MAIMGNPITSCHFGHTPFPGKNSPDKLCQNSWSNMEKQPEVYKNSWDVPDKLRGNKHARAAIELPKEDPSVLSMARDCCASITMRWPSGLAGSMSFGLAVRSKEEHRIGFMWDMDVHSPKPNISASDLPKSPLDGWTPNPRKKRLGLKRHFIPKEIMSFWQVLGLAWRFWNSNQPNHHLHWVGRGWVGLWSFSKFTGQHFEQLFPYILGPPVMFLGLWTPWLLELPQLYLP